MINLKCRTEYSFRTAYGRPEEVLQKKGYGICDRNGTWGHVQFAAAAKKLGIKPVFGVELAVVKDHELKEKQSVNWMSFLAKNNDGLREIYRLTSLATKQMYYLPRISYRQLWDLSDSVIILSGSNPLVGELPRVENLFIEASPAMLEETYKKLLSKGYKPVATSDNYFPDEENREVYEILAGGNKESRTTPMHLLDEWQWRDSCPYVCEDALRQTYTIYDACNAELPQAEMVRFPAKKTLKELCLEGASAKGLDLSNREEYRLRLERELSLIEEKKFEDYFYVLADLINYAKQHMLVGPARGSSCGSLVCYLLGITDIDPLPYGLLFERFIDINRLDLPDIDVDFADDRREMVFEYLREKYGTEKVARLGTVMRYKAKSAIDDVARELQIPVWEVKDLKGAIIERSSGDSRAQFCILDTFENLEVGRASLEKFPGLRVAASLEGHARQSGQHAAGVLVTDLPMSTYCSVDNRTGAVMIDKKDAEDLNLLKIDALGLRTLSVIQDVLDSVGWSREQLLKYPLDNEEAFDILRKQKYTGIFQFEGFALQNICRQMPVRKFEDIAAITALARPGPLTSGATAEYVKRHNGKKVEYIHQSLEKYLEKTYGLVIYQEDVMQIVRNIGNLSWEDTSTLRKAMSKSYGKEYFDKFKERFVAGAGENGINAKDAELIWDNVNTMGSWAFNLSHSIAYGMVSYWCCVLKSKFPLEYAAACLRNSKDEEQVVSLIRELVREGYQYKSFCRERSGENWSVVDGVLIGGLTNLHGIGPKLAQDIIKRRKLGAPLTNRQNLLMEFPKTPYDNIFETEDLWGDMYKNWRAHKLTSQPVQISSITEDYDGEYIIIGKLLTKNLRDLNEVINVQKRGGKIFDKFTEELLFSIGDDSGRIRCKVNRWRFDKIGKKIVEEGKVGDWYVMKGKVRKGFLSLDVEKIRKLERTKDEQPKS